jgi:peptide/nickel transport system substrate-binding protein
MKRFCQALAAMWSQIGVATQVNAMPRANIFPSSRTWTRVYMLGWGGATTDAIFYPAAGAIEQRQG